MALPQDERWQADDYLTWERQQSTKHELIDNYVIDMTGASREHNLITTHIVTSLNIQLQGKPCEVYSSDMRVQVDERGTYTYPDIVVVCGDPQFTEETHVDTLTNPTVLIEVLSPSTELIDRSAKLAQYQKLPSLQSYLLVSQEKPRIESYHRQTDGWRYTDTSEHENILELPSINCELRLTDVYARVQFSD